MIVFNINALLQAILLALIVGLMYLLNLDDRSIWLLYIPFFTVILTYRAGLKGTLFWIVPTWLIACVAMAVYVEQHFESNTTSDTIYAALNYILLLYITYRMVFDGSRAFRKEFDQANLILKNINKTDDYFAENKKQFWIQITHTFVRPGFFYRNLNSLYHMVFRKTVTQKALAEHNLLLIETIKNRVAIPSNAEALNRMESQLRNDRQNGDFDYGYLDDLAKAIDLEVKPFAT